MNAQADSTNLFEYGSPIISSEDNLKNLIRNFPLYIENANTIDLLNYKYIGSIKNKKQSRRYVKNNINRKTAVWGITHTFESENGKCTESKIRFMFDESPSYHNVKEIKEFVNTVSDKYVHVGYEVYMLTFVAGLRAYDYYIFINPQTKRVVNKGNIFGFTISKDHFRLNAKS
jgi:hypothetical protein